MTKFHYLSDLHLEFGMNKPAPQGEYLILAGDITVLRVLNPIMNDSQSRKTRDRTLLYFKHCVENFKKVFYLTGNHESYNFNIQEEYNYIKRYLPSEIVHLDDTEYEIDQDTVLLGSTLWTNMDNRDHITMKMVEHGMNDFHVIYNNAPEDPFTIWTATDAANKHDKSIAFLTEALERNKHRKCVVATHHAPSIKGVNPEHVRDTTINFGYYSDLESFITERPQIKYWVHGHTHVQTKYQIGSTMVVSNAQGYVGYEKSADVFNPNTYFEI